MIKGVLFDKDGTLLEFHSTQHYIYATLLTCLKDDYQVPGPLLQQLSEVLGHLPDRLAPDSLMQFSTNEQIAQALFDTCRDLRRRASVAAALRRERPARTDRAGSLSAMTSRMSPCHTCRRRSTT